MAENCESLVTPLPGQTFIISLVEAINKAQSSIDVIQFEWYFYPDKASSPIQSLNRTVIGKLESGVKMRVLLNKEGREQHLMAINMRTARFLGDAGAVVKFGRTFPINHAKLWIIDDYVVILGSHNLSNRAVSVNNEVSALIKGRSVAMEFRRYFNSLWALL